MSMQELLRDGPPCAARMVDGTLRMTLGGIIWGFISGSHDSFKEGYRGFSRAAYVAKAAGKNSTLWGCCAGIYFGCNCGLERLRNRRDWANAAFGGAVTGALVAAKSRSGSKILATSAALSAIAIAFNRLSPLEYPPTGL